MKLLGAAVALSLMARVAGAQVGYPPNASPYRDIRLGTAVTFGAGFLAGSRGSLDVGPSQGNLWSVRVEKPLGRSLAAHLTFGDAFTTRYIIDPTQDSLSRKTGPYDAHLALATIGLDALLTGGKTWRGFTPYLGVTVGAAIANTARSDTSQYKFGTKVALGPEAGLRWYLFRRLSLRGDWKLLFWKLSYPLQFKQPSPIDGSRVLAVDANSSEWTNHSWITAGLAWTF